MSTLLGGWLGRESGTTTCTNGQMRESDEMMTYVCVHVFKQLEMLGHLVADASLIMGATCTCVSMWAHKFPAILKLLN